MKLSKFIKISIAFVLMLGTVNVYGQFGKRLKKLKKSTSKHISPKSIQKNAEKCFKHFQRLAEWENKINRFIENEQPSKAKNSLLAYRNYLKNLDKDNCMSKKRFTKRADEIQVNVDKALAAYQCKTLLNKMEKSETYLSEAISMNIPNYNVYCDELSKYKRNFKSYKNANCFTETAEFDKKIASWEKAKKNSEISENPFKFFARAVSKNDIKEIDATLENGLKINGLNEYGFSPLAVAVKQGKKEIVAHLIEKGANPNFKNKDGRVPLSLVMSYGNYEDSKRRAEILKLLLSKGADASLANREFIFTRLVKSKIYDLPIQLDKEGTVKLTMKDYIGIYWECPAGSEAGSYFAQKIKSGKVGTSYSEFKEGMHNSALAAKLMKAANSDDSGDPKYSKMKIKSKSWNIVRHSITGVILHRYIHAYGYGSNKDGVCYVNEVKGTSYYDGSNYGPILYGGFGRRNTADCE